MRYSANGYVKMMMSAIMEAQGSASLPRIIKREKRRRSNSIILIKIYHVQFVIVKWDINSNNVEFRIATIQKNS